jgi:hypothetical protein
MCHFHRQPQQQRLYRAARVAAVEDQLHRGVPAVDIGQSIMRLPASFVGSARYYQMLYLDALALPRRFGKPDLFITVTCNPNWPEISNALPAGAKWQNHPDIVSRVFMLKLKSILRDFKIGQIFGVLKAYVYRIEWQARGLPHAHMLLILEHKILSAAQIDAIVSAELPDPVAHPVLHRLVGAHMLHPRCDDVTRQEMHSCRSDSSGQLCDCRRRFPKEMATDTVIIGDGFPKYRRRGLHTMTDRSGRIVTDSWVVPFNMFLLLKYQCHINLEVCANIRSFKYVYKYTFKSPDYTAITVDEISAHLSGRLLSVSEAVHRILALPLHKEWPPVVRLDVHLPRQQTVVFDPTVDEDMLLAQLEGVVSMLMGWFHLNAVDNFARTLCYHEAPEWYTWSKGQWHRRCNKKMAVGRMFGVAPHNIELHSLRRLLSVVKGATSFADLATVVRALSCFDADLTAAQDGHIHSTFRSALFARGLAHDDAHLIATMMEIVATAISVDSIRRHFATLLVHCAPQDAQALFHQFASDLCDGESSDAAVVLEALGAIEVYMLAMGRSLMHADYGFQMDAVISQQDNSEVRRVRRRLLPSAEAMESSMVERDRLVALLTAEQSVAFSMIMAAVGSPNESNVFAVLSSAGCGKTVFANAIAATVRARGRVAICVAASALAAMLLLGGSTAHSKFHIPIPANDGTMCCFSSDDRYLLRNADVILYDECSMVHHDVADTVERSIRDLLQDPRPFGGQVVILMGDFKQLLPVVRYGRGQEHTLQRCLWWRGVTFVKFTLNWRAIRNPDYAALLETIGSGELDSVIVPISCCVDNVDALISAVYGDNSTMLRHQILALTLETCCQVNAACLRMWPGVLQEKFATDTYRDCRDPDSFPHEYIDSLQMAGAPPFCLGLKIGAKYMCIRNIDLSRGLTNGTMLQLLSIGSRTLQFRVTSGSHAGAIELLMPVVFNISAEASGLPFAIERRQFPVIPAFCLSVHKAQGQSLDMVGLIFESDPFAHGQLYVALSRVAGWDRVRVLLRNGITTIKNLVYRHLIV